MKASRTVVGDGRATARAESCRHGAPGPMRTAVQRAMQDCEIGGREERSQVRRAGGEPSGALVCRAGQRLRTDDGSRLL